MVDQIAKQLLKIDAIKFGDFTLASGAKSNVYIDLRQLVSFPALLSQISQSMWNHIKALQFDLLCGVPYTALPIATVISVMQDMPMLMVRKEAKTYGTKKVIEGHFKAGQNCMIIEDVATSGDSIIKAVGKLRDEGIIVTDAIVLVDREAGATDNLKAENINLHSVYKLSELGILKNAKVNI